MVHAVFTMFRWYLMPTFLALSYVSGIFPLLCFFNIVAFSFERAPSLPFDFLPTSFPKFVYHIFFFSYFHFSKMLFWYMLQSFFSARTSLWWVWEDSWGEMEHMRCCCPTFSQCGREGSGSGYCQVVCADRRSNQHFEATDVETTTPCMITIVAIRQIVHLAWRRRWSRMPTMPVSCDGWGAFPFCGYILYLAVRVGRSSNIMHCISKSPSSGFLRVQSCRKTTDARSLKPVMTIERPQLIYLSSTEALTSTWTSWSESTR